jgi:hypothetical protein
MPARAARVSGIVLDSTGRPLPGASIGVHDEGGPAGVSLGGIPRAARTRDDGSFVIPPLAPGEYVLHVRSGRRRDRGDVETATQPLAIAGEDIAGLMVMTRPAAVIEGAVTFDTGAPPRGVAPRRIELISVTPPSFPMRSSERARVEQNWRFMIRNVDGPRHLVVPQAPPGWYLKAVMVGGRDMTDLPLDPRGADRLSGVQVVLTSRRTSVGGIVTDARGRQAEAYHVIAFAEDARKWTAGLGRHVRTARPDQDGRYAVEGLPPGEYLIVALESVPDGEWNNPDYPESMRSFATPLSLDEGEQKGLDLKLSGG